MKQNFYFIGFLAIVGAVTTLNSCKKDLPSEETQMVSYEEVLKSGGEFQPFANQRNLINVTTSSVPVDSGSWNCTNSTWNVVQGNLDFPLYDPNVSVVYPGSLLQGASLNSSTPEVVAVARGGGIVSIDIINGSGSVAVPLTEIRKSSVTQALNDIIYENNKVMPARFTLQHEAVKTQDELALSLGLSLDAWGVSIASNLGFSTGSGLNHYLVALRQSFYTMSFDIPTNYNELFAPTVKPMDLAKYVGPNNPACYVSDVTYGRVFYLLIESKSSLDSMSSAISASYSTYSGTVNASYLNSLVDLNVKVMALGGETVNTFTSIDASELTSLTYLLGQSANIQTGVPLSYVVRTVYNNKLVKNKLDVEYTINDCQLVP